MPASPDNFFKSLTEKERAWLRKHPVIRVVQDPGWPPIEFTDKNGEFVGMSGDFLKIIEDRLNLKFERVQGLTWQEAYSRLKRHEIDMTTSVAMTPERLQFWAFTEPYMKVPIVIVANYNVTYIADIHELNGYKVAVVDGYAVNDWIPKDFPDIRLVRVKTAQEGLMALQRREVFAYIENMLVVGYYMSKLKMTTLKIAGETPYLNAQCMAVRKDWAPLAGILQKALDSISETHRNEIYRKWLPIRYEHGFDYTKLWYALAIFGLILSALIAWNWKLSREIRSRKEAEAALAKSEEKFRLVFESANAGKSITRPTGEIDVNNAFCDMLGYTREELKNKKWQELTHPDDIDANQKLLDPLLRDEKDSVRFKKRYLHKDGHIIWADVSAIMHRDIERNPIFFISTIINITEQKQAEDTNFRIAQEWQTTFDTTNNAIWILGKDQHILRSNRTAERIFQRPCNEFIGKCCWEIVHGTGQPIPDCPLLRAKKSLHRESMDLQIGENWFEVVVDPILNTSGGFDGAVHIVSDITERKRTEEALRKNQNLLNETQQITKVGGWEYNLATRQVTWTDEVYHIYGVSGDYDPGNPENDIEFYTPEYQKIITDAFKRAVEKGEPYDIELQLINGHGEKLWVRTSGQAEWREDRIVRVFGNIMDITERKLAETAQTQLLHILESSLNEIYVFDPVSLAFQYVNQGALRNLGYTIEEMRKMTPLDLKPEFTESSFRQTIEPLIRSEQQRIVLTTVHRRADGSLYPVEVHLQLVELEKKPVFLSIILDITERKHAGGDTARKRRTIQNVHKRDPGYGLSQRRHF